MKPIFSFVFISLMALCANGQTIIWDSIQPRTTDNTMETGAANVRHYIAKRDDADKNTLIVFLPGTSRAPSGYLYMIEQMAMLGYHVIGLTYKTDPAINPICRPTEDVTCHWRARMETIDGVDRHPSVSVNFSNSILNRLQKALNFFNTRYPTGGWGQFNTGNQLQWNKIIVTGHSQGASLSGIMGEEFPVKRVVMWSVIDYLDNGAIPNWVDNATNSSKYYAFIHPKDEQVPFSKAQVGWDKLGMTQYGSMVSSDCNTYPFSNSHILYTTYVPASALVDKYHNGTTLDIYIQNETAYKATLDEAIRYFFRE
jgi:hypothetical protein